VLVAGEAMGAASRVLVLPRTRTVAAEASTAPTARPINSRRGCTAAAGVAGRGDITIHDAWPFWRWAASVTVSSLIDRGSTHPDRLLCHRPDHSGKLTQLVQAGRPNAVAVAIL